MKNTLLKDGFWRAFLLMFFTILFKALVLSFFAFYLFEGLLPGFVSNHFHLFNLLFAAIVVAVIVIANKKDLEIKERSGGWWIIFAWAAICALIIVVRFEDIGAWRYLLGLGAFVIFVFVYKAIVNYKMFGDDED